MGDYGSVCNLARLTTPAKELERLFGLAWPLDFTPQPEIWPTDSVSVIRDRGLGREVACLSWGVVPRWSQGLTDPLLKGKNFFNARAERLPEAKTWRPLFSNEDSERGGRCLVVIDGFFEFRQLPGRRERMFFSAASGSPMALAGLWDRCDQCESATVVTVAANQFMAPIHDRMPAILGAADWDMWLEGDASRAADLLRPAPESLLCSAPGQPERGGAGQQTFLFE